MHIFQVKTLTNIIHSYPIIIVTKALICHYDIDFML